MANKLEFVTQVWQKLKSFMYKSDEKMVSLRKTSCMVNSNTNMKNKLEFVVQVEKL